MFSKKNFLLLAVSTIVSLLLGEIVLRAVTPKADNFNHHQLYCEHDSLLGWRKIPNSQGHHKTAEYEVLESINSMGIRGPEYQLQKDSGEYRIVVVGDSFSEGYTVDFDDLFSEVLEDSLQENLLNQRVEVINLGTGGYSTDQELLCFETEAVKFQPDATVLMFCVNDPWFNNQSRYYNRGFKPVYVLEADSLRLTNVPVPRMESRPFLSKIKDWLLENSELVRRLKNLRDNAYYAANDMAVPDEWRLYEKNNTPEVEASWEITAALLHQFQQKAAASGSSFAVFYIPEKIEVYDADWQEFLATYTLDESKFDAAQPRERLQAICDSLQIAMIDPTPIFLEKAAANPAEPLYFKHDWHWNKHGHQLAGQVLAAFFERK